MEMTIRDLPTNSDLLLLSLEELEMIDGGISFSQIMHAGWTTGTGAIGGIIGGTVGSAISPIIGTATGATVGAVAGGIVGDKIWNSVFK